MSAHDAEDVIQTTWLRYLEHRDEVRDPAAVGAWLHTTARNESVRLLREHARMQPVDPEVLVARRGTEAGPETVLEATERQQVLSEAIETLPERQRELIRTLLAAPDPSYEAIAEILDMPIGSVGPTRARAFERLRFHPGLAALMDEGEQTRRHAASWQDRTDQRSVRCTGACATRMLTTLHEQVQPPRIASLSLQELRRVGNRVDRFAGEMFQGAMRRAEQRAWGRVYLRGLMLEGGRKSIEPIAARLPEGNEQSLQQFVNQSPWSSARVRANLARRVTAELAPTGWVIGEVGISKKGRWSVGVARQYCPALGRAENCQIGLSVNAATPDASCPVDWRIYLPKSWEHDALRRARAYVPDGVHHLERWRLALEAIDELRTWGLEPPPIVAPGLGDISAFTKGLEQRGLRYLVEVSAATRVWSDSPHLADGSAALVSVAELARIASACATEDDVWRRRTATSKQQLRYLALRICSERLRCRAGLRAGERSHPHRWLLAASSPGNSEPTRYWLSNLSPDCPPRELTSLAKLPACVERDHHVLKDELGLHHFEGRSFRGWHHHATLVSVAHAFLTIDDRRRRMETAMAGLIECDHRASA